MPAWEGPTAGMADVDCAREDFLSEPALRKAGMGSWLGGGEWAYDAPEKNPSADDVMTCVFFFFPLDPFFPLLLLLVLLVLLVLLLLVLLLFLPFLPFLALLLEFFPFFPFFPPPLLALALALLELLELLELLALELLALALALALARERACFLARLFFPPPPPEWAGDPPPPEGEEGMSGLAAFLLTRVGVFNTLGFVCRWRLFILDCPSEG